MSRTYSGDVYSVVQDAKTGVWHVGYWLAGGQFRTVDVFELESEAREDAKERNVIARMR